MANYIAVRTYDIDPYIISDYEFDISESLLPDKFEKEVITNLQFNKLKTKLLESNTDDIHLFHSCSTIDLFSLTHISPNNLIKWYLYAAVNQSVALLPTNILNNLIKLIDRTLISINTKHYKNNKLRLIRFVSKYKNYLDQESLELILVTLFKY